MIRRPLGASDTPPPARRATRRALDAFHLAPPEPVAPRAVVTTPGPHSVTFVYDAGPHAQLTNLRLKGSWGPDGVYRADWPASGVPMQNLGNGQWALTVELQDDGVAHDWEWGVTADGPSGLSQWAVLGEGNLKVDLTQPAARYAPTTYHEMGAQRRGEDLTFRFWAPDARAVQVKVTGPDGKDERITMARDDDGDWVAEVAGGLRALEGKAYVYQLVDSTGATVERPDPYARERMGEQRGVDRLYVDSGGAEVNRYTPGALELMTFSVDEEEQAAGAALVFYDDTGHQLDSDELWARLGPVDAPLIDEQGQDASDRLWHSHVEPTGRVALTNVGGEWVTFVNNPNTLIGLHYELQVVGQDGQLVGDQNHDRALSDAERRATFFNDPWSNRLTALSGVSARASIITDPARFHWSHDDAPRERDPAKWVVYQLHVGSFLGQGGNLNRSTFEDLQRTLDSFSSLGVTTLELLPTNEVEGSRDWGYQGVDCLAVESALGFEDEPTGQWVSGTEALKRFIDAAHGKGLNVVSDVVYNHVLEEDAGLWNLDGPENPYFKWKSGPEQRATPWGLMPALDNAKVRQFYVDHAVQQVEELKFDGLRFDFTEPIKGAGGKAGWDFLREVNRQVHFFRPQTWTVAEQFDYVPAMTRPPRPDDTGAGFDAQWYTEFQHRLVHDNNRPGLVQAAARGQRTDVDAFMSLLTAPRGLDDWKKALTIISNHDEVGNAERTMNTAEGATPTDFPSQWARGAARFAAGLGFASPGVPMFFQGDEFGAQNDFRWGVPATWDSGWSWESLGPQWAWDALTFDDAQRSRYQRLFELGPDARAIDPEYVALSTANRRVFDDVAAMAPGARRQAMLDITRRQQFRFYQDAIGLRRSSPALQAGGEVARVYTHNDDSVLAFTRKSGNDEFLVIGSLNHRNLAGYSLPLPPGRWVEVLNSDSARYGGGNFGNSGGTLSGQDAKVNIPAAGYVVFRKA